MIPQHQERFGPKLSQFPYKLQLVIQKSYIALSFALSFITENKEVKAKCLKEIQNVCLLNGQLDISTENLKKLPYLEACINETLRLRIRFSLYDIEYISSSSAY